MTDPSPDEIDRYERRRRSPSARGLRVLIAALVVLAGCAPLASDARQSGTAASVVGGSANQTAEEGASAVAGLPGGELTVHFLDVGQGDASLVIAPDATMLIDTGRHDAEDLVPQLRALGVARIDVVAITHAHADHVGQLDEVLGAFDVDEVWMPGTTSTSLIFEEGVAAIEASEAAYEEPRAGDRTSVGSLGVDVLHPSTLTGNVHGDMLAMRVSYGSLSVLFTGDAEADVEAEMVQRDKGALAATIYQVGHHGSSTSTSSALLEAVSPEVAVYSAGEGNSYGHPHAEVLDRLTGAGVEVYGTDVHGSVTVVSDGVGYSVTPAATGQPAEASPATSPVKPAPPSSSLSAPTKESPSAAGCKPGQVDINSAGAQELDRIVHIGPVFAEEIVALRPFESLEDIERVDGIGDAKASDIMEEALACAS
jgi:competence protein ComEC